MRERPAHRMPGQHRIAGARAVDSERAVRARESTSTSASPTSAPPRKACNETSRLQTTPHEPEPANSQLASKAQSSFLAWTTRGTRTNGNQQRSTRLPHKAARGDWQRPRARQMSQSRNSSCREVTPVAESNTRLSLPQHHPRCRIGLDAPGRPSGISKSSPEERTVGSDSGKRELSATKVELKEAEGRSTHGKE